YAIQEVAFTVEQLGGSRAEGAAVAAYALAMQPYMPTDYQSGDCAASRSLDLDPATTAFPTEAQPGPLRAGFLGPQPEGFDGGEQRVDACPPAVIRAEHRTTTRECTVPPELLEHECRRTVLPFTLVTTVVQLLDDGPPTTGRSLIPVDPEPMPKKTKPS